MIQSMPSVETLLLLVVEQGQRWPAKVIPATEGGRVFKELSTRTGAPEVVIAAAAQQAGVWPWYPGHIHQAFRLARDFEGRLTEVFSSVPDRELSNAYLAALLGLDPAGAPPDGPRARWPKFGANERVVHRRRLADNEGVEAGHNTHSSAG